MKYRIETTYSDGTQVYSRSAYLGTVYRMAVRAHHHRKAARRKFRVVDEQGNPAPREGEFVQWLIARKFPERLISISSFPALWKSFLVDGYAVAQTRGWNGENWEIAWYHFPTEHDHTLDVLAGKEYDIMIRFVKEEHDD